MQGTPDWCIQRTATGIEPVPCNQWHCNLISVVTHPACVLKYQVDCQLFKLQLERAAEAQQSKPGMIVKNRINRIRHAADRGYIAHESHQIPSDCCHFPNLKAAPLLLALFLEHPADQNVLSFYRNQIHLGQLLAAGGEQPICLTQAGSVKRIPDRARIGEMFLFHA